MSAQLVDAALALGRACAAHDGMPPFGDQALVELRRGERRAIGDASALAVVSDAEREVELAVHPEARGRGLGLALAQRVADELGAFDAWAHGDLPAARAIAERLGMERVRELLQLRASLDDVPAWEPAPVRAFEPADASALLAVNAAAFADHPEQGRLTAADLDDRFAEHWHDHANLLVLGGEGGAIDAFAWLKPAGDVVELYAIGVSPARQGEGLGRSMLAAAHERMRRLGTTAHLYVEGDNAPALALYERAGYERWAIDVRWRRLPFTRD